MGLLLDLPFLHLQIRVIFVTLVLVFKIVALSHSGQAITVLALEWQKLTSMGNFGPQVKFANSIQLLIADFLIAHLRVKNTLELNICQTFNFVYQLMAIYYWYWEKIFITRARCLLFFNALLLALIAAKVLTLVTEHCSFADNLMTFDAL